jgi:hypothetical protein
MPFKRKIRKIMSSHNNVYVGKLGPAAEGYLQNLATVACSTGVVDRGVWLRISHQYLSCALVRGRGIAFHHFYCSLAKSAGKDFRDGADEPFE